MSLMAFLAQFCFLLGYPAPWRTYDSPYMPGPQFCPDTGRTVCTAVDYYPTEQIYHLLTSTRSQVFNLTSLFVDERNGDVEPNLPPLPTPKPHYQNGYGGHQPPPGGRFSPAGYNSWNTPTSDRPPVFTGLQPDRWRQVSTRNGQAQGGPSRDQYTPGYERQSRAQALPNQRMSFNMGRGGPPVTQKFNYEDRAKPGGQRDLEEAPGPYGNHGMTQNRIDPQQNGPYGALPHFGGVNLTRYFPQDVQQQDPYQIQPPQTQYSVKGQNPHPGITVRPQTVANWKGAPAFNDRSGVGTNIQRNSQNSKFNNGKRKRRNEDVEVACRVRSTYVPPRAALNDNSEWKYIVNVPERDRRFTQVVRVDICLSEGEPCSSRLSLPFGFESRCRQKFIKKKLLSLNPDGQGTSEDNFFIPSCCVCEIVRQDRK